MYALNEFEEKLVNLTDGGHSLQRDEWDCIYLFTMLYAFAETKWSNIGTDVGSTGDVAEWFLSSGRLDNVLIADVHKYYSIRYLEGGVVNRHFHSLFPDAHARGISKSSMITLMEMSSPNEKQKLSLCLKVAHCLRNNLFHGDKWKNHFAGQKDNFTAANDLLQMILFTTKGCLWNNY